MFRIFNQRKQIKIRWLQDPNQSNVDNLNNVRREASRYYGGGGYLKAKINERKTNSKIKKNQRLVKGH
jgi:hypothetical protein